MPTTFTISDFILIIPMALAGALFLDALPTSSRFIHNMLRVLGRCSASSLPWCSSKGCRR